mgnify:FL=1
MKSAIINARIIDTKNNIDEVGGILINSKGLIEACGKQVTKDNVGDNKIYDCKNKLVIPGIIDGRVFVGEPGFEYKENYRTLSKAAISGGVTSVVTMPNTNPIIDNVSTFDFIQRRARDKSLIKIHSLASLTKNIEGNEITEFGLLKLNGAVGFTDGIKCIQKNDVMDKIFNYGKNQDSLILQFPQDNELSKNGSINESLISTKLGLKGIPDYAEHIIIERDLRLLSKYRSKYHISLLSSGKSLEIINEWKKKNLEFTTGVSINHLSLNENDIGEFRTFLKLSPPLRKEQDRLDLIEGIRNKSIDIIVSDHKPEDEESKRLTFQKCATGASGIETFLSLALEQYHNENLDLKTIIKCITENPARIFQINAGSLEKGMPADIAVLDLEKPWVVKRENMQSKSKNTAIEDRKLQGMVEKTFLNGKLVFEI